MPFTNHWRLAKSTRDDKPTKRPSAVPEPKDILYFWRPDERKHGFLSMLYPSPFRDSYFPRKVYPTAEHYLQHHKALLFGDEDTANAVLKCNDPHEARKLADGIKNFDQNIWEENRERIAHDANWHKFTAPYTPRDTLPESCKVWLSISDEALQHAKQMKEALLATDNRQIVHASPLDFIWGNGYWWRISWEKREKWGLNLLGIILMDVRDRIRREEKLKKAMESQEN
ncbi:hypothetical protein Daesc_001092 [Daldinia eschscholtzii]|uniref:NADAR domain-containing protein n=1 Tax=Daldinia eschscholtzii TaxID=292717 RepID=A0AAX6N0M0_9PEZI